MIMESAGVETMRMLSDAWHTLRLSVGCPARIRTWDAIVLTAASPDQADLLSLQLERAKGRGVIATETILLAVSDPGGRRIGSGAATLHAIRTLANKISQSDGSRELQRIRVLLLHTGGDSKRVPWANCIGKAFIPVPFLANEDPDGPVPTLFDHILAVSSGALQAFSGSGGLLILTGDVLPCFDASAMVIPEDGVCVVTVPSALDVARNHGVIVSSSWNEDFASPSSYPGHDRIRKGKHFLVDDLLQKPTVQEMHMKSALSPAGTVLLDTGIFALQGNAWLDLISLTLVNPDPVEDVLSSGAELSLYEEVAGAWVPARHAWLLKDCQLGKKLIDGLGHHKLNHYCSYELKFLHFGTSGEVLHHLGENYGTTVGRRHFSSVAGAMSCEVASSAVVVASEILGGASIGDESLVFDCTLGSGVLIGARCVVMGIDTEKSAVHAAIILLKGAIQVPDCHCLWEVPLKGKKNKRVTLCCGIEDNPKLSSKQGGTFCGKTWVTFLLEHGIVEEDLWSQSSHQPKNLWNAALFSVLDQESGINFALWLMGPAPDNQDLLCHWRDSERVSFAEVHGQTDFFMLQTEFSSHRARLASGFAKASIQCGSYGRNLAKLSTELLSLHGESGLVICKELLDLCTFSKASQVPSSRAYQVKLDLSKACGDESTVASLEECVWEAVALETITAVSGQHLGVAWNGGGPNGFIDHTCRSPSSPSCFSVSHAKVELPVRVDFAGGWSDTPPWSLERIGRVLNMAVVLEGHNSVGAEVMVTQSTGMWMSDDLGNTASIEDLGIICLPLKENDPFRLIKAALIAWDLLTILHSWA